MIEFEKATKLWQLWEIALHDLKLCEADPKYVIDMVEWYVQRDVCSVCAAGAVIAQRLKTEDKRLIGPQDFNDAIRIRLKVIDNLRVGALNRAYLMLTGCWHKCINDTLMPDYENSHWWKTAEQLLNHLKKEDV